MAKVLHIASNTPLLVGGALIIPQGMLDQKEGKDIPQWAVDPVAWAKVEKMAMDAVMEHERSLGHEPEDVANQKHGWDIISRTSPGEFRFVEVKGRVKGAPIITVTKRDILASLNQPERFILAIVLIDGESAEGPYYLREPFDQEPGFGVTNINFELKTLLANAEPAN